MGDFTLASPCSAWTDVEAVRAVCDGVEDVDDEVVDSAITLAGDLLYSFSGRQFSGTCEETIRPCTSGRTCFEALGWDFTGHGGYPIDISLLPLPICCCVCVPQYDLGKWPVTDVTEILINGVAFTDYRVDDYRWIVRLDGDGWPRCQHITLPTTEDGTWSVTFEYGLAIPPGGVTAANRLACELARAGAGKKCALPGRATRVDRQGVSVTLIDPAQLEKGRTGIFEVDLWLAAVNPDNRRSGTRLWSPDLPPAGGRRTGT